MIKIFLMALLTGCSAASLPLITTPMSVSNCKLLDKVEGLSGHMKNPEWRELAKYSALRQSMNMGATHIVLGGYSEIGESTGSLDAEAYQCK